MMTVHVLHAGDGYTYLTRQVASGDVTRERGQSLTDYYLAHGNPPGQWVGSGRESLGVSGQVSEAQMKALFGEGLHPDADGLITAAIDAGASVEKALSDVRLGRLIPKLSSPCPLSSPLPSVSPACSCRARVHILRKQHRLAWPLFPVRFRCVR